MSRLPFLPTLMLLFSLGCASPGPPRPPSLHLPENATGLAAARVGDAVRISWTSPLNTTDGDRIKGSMTAVLCRELPPRGGCAVIEKLTVVSGPSSATDSLPPNLCSGPPRLLLYRVELQNAKGHSAGQSDPVSTAAGAAPPPVGALTLSARRNAVLIRWPSVTPSGSAVMEFKRTLEVAADASAKPVASVSARPAAKGLGSLRGGKLDAGVVTLRSAPRAGVTSADGLLDPTVTDGANYIYLAQWVSNVTVAGHAVELRGLPSPAAKITFHDVFPPRAPADLVAIPGEGFGAPLLIDLSWESNDEIDLMGYYVYRRTGKGDFGRVTTDPVSASAYRDLKVEAGQTYTYRVTAVDQRGNESAPSNEVQEIPRP